MMTKNTRTNLSLNTLNSFASVQNSWVYDPIGPRHRRECCLTLLATRVLLLSQVKYDHWSCSEIGIGITLA